MALRNVSRYGSVLVALVCCAMLGACAEGEESGGVGNPTLPGPCVEVSLTPVIEVSSALVNQGAAAIDSLFISRALLDGHSVRLDYLVESPAFNVEIVGGFLVGRVPFGFGVLEGHYTLDVSAPGMVGATLEIDASYDVHEGGCPSYSRGPTKVSVVLDPK